MTDVRWNTPFDYSFAYKLFEKHFTELNEMYWAHVPAANTIQKMAMEFQTSGDNIPTHFFIIPDKDDRRLARDFIEWKEDYNQFLNFTRLHMVLSLNSCFEIYMRSIVSLAIESKPGIVFGDKNAIDGAKLLKNSEKYFINSDDTYPFYTHVTSVCKKEWTSRCKAYERLFGTWPCKSNDNIKELDQLRNLRNDIAHYSGREKSKYEAPVSLTPEPAARVSHDRMLKYLKLINDTAKAIDKHLYKEYVGSYEVLKYYMINKTPEIENQTFKELKAQWLQKQLGDAGARRARPKYYKDLILYFDAL